MKCHKLYTNERMRAWRSWVVLTVFALSIGACSSGKMEKTEGEIVKVKYNPVIGGVWNSECVYSYRVDGVLFQDSFKIKQGDPVVRLPKNGGV